MPLGTLLPFAFPSNRRFLPNIENKIFQIKKTNLWFWNAWRFDYTLERGNFFCVLLRLCDVATICWNKILHTLRVPFLWYSNIKLNGWKRLTTFKANSSDCSDACVFKNDSQFDRLSVIYFIRLFSLAICERFIWTGKFCGYFIALCQSFMV